MLTSRDIGTSVGLSVGSEVPIRFTVDAEDERVTLVIGARSECEIEFEGVNLTILRDLADEALRELAAGAGEVE